MKVITNATWNGIDAKPYGDDAELLFDAARLSIVEEPLKPCPFCGKEALYCSVDGYVSNRNMPTAWAICRDISCMTRPGVPVDKWQSRPLEDAQADVIAVLKAELAALREAASRVVWGMSFNIAYYSEGFRNAWHFLQEETKRRTKASEERPG